MLRLSEEEKNLALRTSRLALIEYLERGVSPAGQTQSPGLIQPRGAFVTLRQRATGKLRGCRGACRSSSPLIESIIKHTICAATDDPRFDQVCREEVPELFIRINALSPTYPIQAGDIVLGRHGLLLIKGRRSGLLLPEVPAHYGLRSPEEFLDALFRKARLPSAEPWTQDLELYAFETEVWGEDDESEPGMSSRTR